MIVVQFKRMKKKLIEGLGVPVTQELTEITHSQYTNQFFAIYLFLCAKSRT